METQSLFLEGDDAVGQEITKAVRELQKEKERQEAAASQETKLSQQLAYMEAYWEEVERDYECREKAIAWMRGLPKGNEGTAEFLNGMTGRYANAFAISIVIHDPLRYTVHWFDDTRTEVEMDTNIEDYRFHPSI